MSARVLFVLVIARLRVRGVWAIVLGLGAALYPRTLPEGAFAQEVDMRVGMALAGVVLALVLAQGSVSRDLRSGALLLWIQKPGRPSTHYATRLVALFALTLALHAVLTGGLALAGSPVPSSPGTFVALVLGDLTAVTLVFLVSASRVPAEGLVAFLGLALVTLVAPIAFVEPETFGRWAPALGAIRAPTLETVALTRWIDGLAVRPTATALLRPILYPLAAAGLALFLVEVRVRSAALPGPDEG